MKASDWNFDQYLPDSEDIEAHLKTLEQFLSRPHLIMNDGEREIHNFTCGFWRGVAWALAKEAQDGA